MRAAPPPTYFVLSTECSDMAKSTGDLTSFATQAFVQGTVVI